MDYRNIFKLAIISLFSSCGLFPPKMVESLGREGINQPIKSTYHLSNNSYVFNPLIDTTAIYLYSDSLIERKSNNGQIYYQYMRFSSTGLVYFSGFYLNAPSENDFNSFTHGQYCFYTVDGNIVKIEIYMHHPKLFEFWYGYINPTGIQFYKYEFRPWLTSKGALNVFFEKKEANLINNIIFP